MNVIVFAYQKRFNNFNSDNFLERIFRHVPRYQFGESESVIIQTIWNEPNEKNYNIFVYRAIYT